MDLGSLISLVLPIVIVLFCFLFMWRIFKPLMSGFGRKKMMYDPSSVGDRLKKNIILAAKANPNKSKILKLRRTQFNEGGKIGRIWGVVTTGDVTRFVFKSGFFGFKKVLYCPVSMHTSLHHREVLLHAISLTNDCGFYFPVPINEDNYIPYTICFDAFQKDIKKMERMDVQQIELEQTIAAMIGGEETQDIIAAPEELPVTETGDEDFA